MALSKPGPSVLHFTGCYLPRTENWIYTQIHSARRYSPSVLTYRLDNPELFPVDRLQCIETNRPKAIRALERIRKALTGLDPFICKELSLHKPDLIHAHFGQAGCWICREATGKNIPLVTTFYGVDASKLALQPIWLKRYRELFAKGTLFLAEGPHLGKTLVELGCPEEKVRVHHLGVDVSAHPAQSASRKSGDPFRILVAASFREKKGVDDALRAFAEAFPKGKGAELNLIGDGPLRGRLESLVRELRLERSVRFYGFQALPDLLKAMSEAHVFLHPSRTADDGDTEGGAPVTIIHAQASGLPVVSTFHADIPEVVREGETGLLAPERDIRGLATALKRLEADPELAARLGRRGRERMGEEYENKRQAERLEMLYDEACRRKGI